MSGVEIDSSRGDPRIHSLISKGCAKNCHLGRVTGYFT